jgi:hypothetical protein
VRLVLAGGWALALAGCTMFAGPAARPAPSVAPAGVLDQITLPEAPAPDPPRATGQDALTGFLAAGDVRPQVAARAIHFDVDALPFGRWGDPSRDHGFRIARLGWNEYQLVIGSMLYAEVTVSGTAQGGQFTAFTGGSFSQGPLPECGRGHAGRFPARWAGIDPRHWTDADVGVELATADFDAADCRASARVTVEARAAAILPGFVYALRFRREEGEALIVFLPRAVVMSTSDDPSWPLDHVNTGPYTRLTFPLEANVGRSAALRISPASLHLWSRLRASVASVGPFQDATLPGDNLLVGIDVINQAGATTGTITLALPPKTDARPYARVFEAAGER